MKEEGLVKDIVCGMVKPKEEMPFTSVYQGKKYYFCAKIDKDMFDAHPDRWVKGGGGR